MSNEPGAKLVHVGGRSDDVMGTPETEDAMASAMGVRLREIMTDTKKARGGGVTRMEGSTRTG